MHVPSLVMKHITSLYAYVLQCTSQHALGSKGLMVPVIVDSCTWFQFVNVCLAWVFSRFLWLWRWEVFLCCVVSVSMLSELVFCMSVADSALLWIQTLRWGQNTLSLLLVLYPIIKNVIYWQASTITQGLSSPLSFMMFILPEAKFRWREKRVQGEKRDLWFLTLCHLL